MGYKGVIIVPNQESTKDKYLFESLKLFEE